jgi:hypothetical protein
LQLSESFRRLPLVLVKLMPKIMESGAHRRIGQGIGDSRIELGYGGFG